MRQNIKLIKLKKIRTFKNKHIFLNIIHSFNKLKFKIKKIYFHDYKTKHVIENKINNYDSIFMPVSGTLYFSSGKQKIIIKKGNALFVGKKIKFNLKSAKSYFLILSNTDFD